MERTISIDMSCNGLPVEEALRSINAIEILSASDKDVNDQKVEAKT